MVEFLKIKDLAYLKFRFVHFLILLAPVYQGFIQLA